MALLHTVLCLVCDNLVGKDSELGVVEVLGVPCEAYRGGSIVVGVCMCERGKGTTPGRTVARVVPDCTTVRKAGWGEGGRCWSEPKKCVSP